MELMKLFFKIYDKDDSLIGAIALEPPVGQYEIDAFAEDLEAVIDDGFSIIPIELDTYIQIKNYSSSDNLKAFKDAITQNITC